jgi:CRISPR-associated endoribonuclease Cas6
MHHVLLTFTPLGKPLDGRFITARGLHGLLFDSLKHVDLEEAVWLHDHAAPKPFSLVPLYSNEGYLVGMRLATITDRATLLFMRAWEWARDTERPLRLGKQAFTVSTVECVPGPGWLALARTPPESRVHFRFLSPTAFKQGPGSLPLPVPVNVFSWPMRVWQAFAPPSTLPEGWLDWCEREVFVVAHDIETVRVTISRPDDFTGFVGEVHFAAHQGSSPELSAWQALSNLAAFSGIGHKTTMGMGAVERIE